MSERVDVPRVVTMEVDVEALALELVSYIRSALDMQGIPCRVYREGSKVVVVMDVSKLIERYAGGFGSAPFGMSRDTSRSINFKVG